VLHKIWESSEDNRSATKTKLFDNCLAMLLERYEKDVSSLLFYIREFKKLSKEKHLLPIKVFSLLFPRSV